MTKELIKALDEEIEYETKLGEDEYVNPRMFDLMSPTIQRLCEDTKPKGELFPFVFTLENYLFFKEHGRLITPEEYCKVRTNALSNIKQRIFGTIKEAKTKKSADEILAALQHLKKKQDEINIRLGKLDQPVGEWNKSDD